MNRLAQEPSYYRSNMKAKERCRINNLHDGLLPTVEVNGELYNDIQIKYWRVQGEL